MSTNFQSGGLLPSQPVNPSPSWDRLSSSTISVLSAKTEGTVLCQAGVCAHLLCKVGGTYLQMFPCSTAKKETASCSHWETMSARGLGFTNQRYRNVSHFFPQSHTVPALSSPSSGSCLSCNMGTPHYTAHQWQHRPLQLRKGSQGLILPMLFWWVTRTSATSHCWRPHSSSLLLLQGYAKENMTMVKNKHHV